MLFTGASPPGFRCWWWGLVRSQGPGHPGVERGVSGARQVAWLPPSPDPAKGPGPESKKGSAGTMGYGAAMGVVQEPESGLSLGGVLHNIPTDPVAVFIYVLLLAGVVWIIAGSRKTGGGAKPVS